MNKVYIVFVETESDQIKLIKFLKHMKQQQIMLKVSVVLGEVHKVINQNMYIRLIIT